MGNIKGGTKGICIRCLISNKFCKNLCRSCYYYVKNNKTFIKKTERKNALKGQGTIRKDGYKMLTKKGHPNSGKDGRILEHTFVMSEYLGRPLEKNEQVHHKNGIRSDNRIENLELWSTSQPSGQRIEDKIIWCEEFLKKYKNL